MAKGRYELSPHMKTHRKGSVRISGAMAGVRIHDLLNTNE
jgi:hypothetical protein